MLLTRGGFVGTPAFASPEQFAQEPVDVRSDIYSLGAMLWYLLTGQLPFTGPTVDAIAQKQNSRALPLAQLKAARVPRCLVSLLVAMLARQPAARPGTRELASRLETCRRQLRDRWRIARRLAFAAAFLSVAIMALLWLRRDPEESIPDKSIAVLPFENLSDDQTNVYFADGIQDQIVTKLASVADLKVISRASTAKYKSRAEDVKAVSQQLGVATIVQGTVQKAGERVRVNVQLIDARVDTHLWGKSYDRALQDVFALQSEISQEIADALRAKLSPSEALVLAAAPTRDSEAYDLFLKGEYEERHAEAVLTAEPFDRAAAFYRDALARDPQFTLAAARLARSRLWRHWFVTPLTPQELAEVKRMVDQALVAAPDLAESHMALGRYHYHGHRDYAPALVAFRRALELQPNHADARLYSGYAYRRQGEWERSLAEMRKAEALDPRDAAIAGNIAATYVNVRQWTDAKRAASRCLALDPHNVVGQLALFQSHLNGDGSTEAARRALAALPRVALTTNAVRGSVSNVVEDFTYLHVLERNFAGALQQCAKETAQPAARVPQMIARVAIRVLAGDRTGDGSESEEARVLLEGRLAVGPNDPFTMTQLSWVYLALGRNSDAVAIATRAAESLPLERDAFGGPAMTVGLAQVQTHADQPREAIATLRRMLSVPAGIAISINRLKIDPAWDPIRADPEFQQLLAGGEFVGTLPAYGR
jgi:TolB-like protein/Flp pilus assembly protein TadD